MNLLGMDSAVSASGAVALGLFDGVHLGHRAVLNAAAACANAHGYTACAFTFAADSVPQKRGYTLEYLYTDVQKFALMEKCGITAVYASAFGEICALDGERFCQSVLIDRFHAKDVFCGADFRFGAKAAWNVEALEAFGIQMGFRVHRISPVCYGGEVISSTRIRRAVKTGMAEHAAALLGAPYQICGNVIHGAARGRKHAVPTINIPFASGQLVPAYGVYVSRTHTKQGTFDSVTDIGVKPTVSQTQPPAAETFLLSFSGDLYNQPCTVELLHFLRAEQKFPDETALYRQIARDQQDCLAWLAAHRTHQLA